MNEKINNRGYFSREASLGYSLTTYTVVALTGCLSGSTPSGAGTPESFVQRIMSSPNSMVNPLSTSSVKKLRKV